MRYIENNYTMIKIGVKSCNSNQLLYTKLKNMLKFRVKYKNNRNN